MDNYSGSYGKRPFYDDDDAGERNSRQKKRPSSTTEPPSQAEETEYRILCPISKIGSLIGKGGSIIKALRTECRSKIKVEDPVSGSEERVVLISSSADQSRENGYYVCAAQEALLKVFSKITEVDDEDEPPQPVSVRLLVPKSHIGCLLGKGGKIIEQMRKDIGAQIRILPKEKHPPSAGSSDELVQVTGDIVLVRKALFEISTRLHDNLSGERTQKSGHVPQNTENKMMPMFGAAGGMYPSAGYLQAGSLLGPSIADPMQGGLGYSYGGMYGGMYGDAEMGNRWDFSMPSAGTGTNAHADGATEEEFLIRFLCPSSRIGSIIGRSGSIIKKMREDTGAKIKVEEQIPDCDERTIIISSMEYVDTYPSPVIQATLQVFRRLVDLQIEKDMDNKSFVVRLLVPSNQIGCLLGKGGNIVSEMRKVTKANIRISPKDEPSKCARENDELVQVMGDQLVVHDALLQILNRLRGNVFKGQEGPAPSSRFGSVLPLSGGFYSGTSMLNSYRGGFDSSSVGTMYPLTNVGYSGMDYGLSGMGSQTSLGRDREGKDSKRRQR
ncbi:hypothetical protein KP509_14G007100 [Ceratopteris richardii]|uniref:K Homology domain-containing protein n=1 Tax=Ceratopteris richardii TaxID=49495 RepID=A0A8T2T6U9_CERRI|nr:hypothetical protein KP509_14G007100 [Ceratopteris richardii]